jgi:hypothetical protein
MLLCQAPARRSICNGGAIVIKNYAPCGVSAGKIGRGLAALQAPLSLSLMRIFTPRGFELRRGLNAWATTMLKSSTGLKLRWIVARVVKHSKHDHVIPPQLIKDSIREPFN